MTTVSPARFLRAILPALSLAILLIAVYYLNPRAISPLGFQLMFNLAIPIALATKVKDRALAEAFIAYLDAGEGKRAFEKWHYFTTEAAARAHAQPTTPVGGEYVLPERWK